MHLLNLETIALDGAVAPPSAAARALKAKCSTFNRVLGGSWVVIHGVIIRVTIHIAHIRGLITPLITTHEPRSSSGPRVREISKLEVPVPRITRIRQAGKFF